MTEESTSLTPDSRFINEALREELLAAQENRWYLLSIVKQMQHEFAEAQDQWHAERASLLLKIQENSTDEEE